MVIFVAEFSDMELDNAPYMATRRNHKAAQRADILNQIASFLSEMHKVDTPAASHATVTDVHFTYLQN